MIGVLFLQSQGFLGADSALHAMLLRHFDRREVRCHVALNRQRPGNPRTDAYPYFAGIDDCTVLPTNFGPTVYGTGLAERARLAATQGTKVPLTLVKLAGYVRKHGLQILHGTEKPRDAFYGTVIGKLSGAKSVIHMHINYGDWQSRATKWSLAHCDAIIGVSEFTAKSIVDAGFEKRRVFAVPNCFDADPQVWNPDAVDGLALRREWGIPGNAPVVGIVARLFTWKGHADLVEAIAKVRETVPDVRLVIVGEDDPRAHGGKSFRAELETQIAALGLTGNVIFAGFRTDTPQVFAALDVYAMPTWEEPWGMVFLEAATMRKPSVAYRSGGVPEAVADGETGFLVAPKDVSALAARITELLTDKALRDRMGVAARARVLRDFSPARMCENVVAVYRETLGVAPETAKGTAPA